MKKVGFILCTLWLLFSIAFFSMITSGGEANMELELGHFLKLKNSSAIFFTRALIVLGLLMLILFILKRPIGFFLGLLWSMWWGIILATALFDSSSFSERMEIIVVVLLFFASGWFSFTLLKAKRSGAAPNPKSPNKAEGPIRENSNT